jgi:hypothetical protein
MRLSPVEQALWYLNIAAALFLIFRVYRSGLISLYPALFTYFLADIVEQIAQLAFGHGGRIYAQIYFVGQSLKIALAILVVLELYQLALAKQPALARFGTRTLGYVFAIAIVAGIANFFINTGTSEGQNKRLIQFLRLENTMDLVTLVILALITGFLLWFPVRSSRNVALCLGGFVLYTFERWAGLVFTSFWPQWTHPLSIAMLSASFCCLALWSFAFRLTGEVTTVVTGHRWNPAEAERLTVQLDAINARLVRLVRP